MGRYSVLDGRPPITPAQRVPSELVVAVSEANVRVGVVVVQDGPVGGIRQDTLAARAKHDTMAAEDKGAAITIQTTYTIAINVGSTDALRSADIYFVLLTGSRIARIVPTALARAKEQVIPAIAIVHKRTLKRMLSRGIVRDVEGVTRRGGGIVSHGRLEDIVPE